MFSGQVVGAGAVGTAVTSWLRESGVRAELIDRTGQQAERRFFAGNRGTLVKKYSLPCDAEFALFTVKAFQLEPAFAQHLPGFAPGTTVIPVANGDIEPIIRQAQQQFPHLSWRRGIATCGITATATNAYALRSQRGVVSWGPLPNTATAQQPQTWEQQICQDNPHFVWLRDITAEARKKWLFNCVINTICAAYDLASNGEVRNDLPLLRMAFDEAWELGIKRWGPWPGDRETTYDAMIELAKDTASNENSMRRDLRLGSRTESEFLAGLADPQGPILYALHRKITTA